ncbi:MAG: ABC transporter permease [Methanoculleaceae archaeon]
MEIDKQEQNKFSGIRTGIISLVSAIIIWQLSAMFLINNPFILPSFTDVCLAAFKLAEDGEIAIDLGISLLHFAIGMGAASAIGVPVGMLMGWFPEVDAAANPIVEFLRPIPPLAWIPFAIVWFGLTHGSAGFVVFIGAVFPILINTCAGFSSVPRIYVDAARVLGCDRSIDLLRYVALPAAVPYIVTGIRTATGVGWMCMVAAEIFGASKHGLGKMLWEFYNLHQMPDVMVYMVILGIIGLFFDLLFRRYVRKNLLLWQDMEVR